jgi:thiol-disulfide isomerase/thioredoxin
MRKSLLTLALVATLAISLGWSNAFAQSAGDRLINASRPGETIELKPYLVAHKINIFDFYSQYCGPCMRMAPLLEKLTEKRKDVVVNRIDINRPNIRGIDWHSPVAQQYKLESIPQFKVFDEHGKLIAEGDEASSMVIKMLQDAKVVE